MTKTQIFILTYFIVLNLIGLGIMRSDKRRAVKHAWRIPEKMLFLVSLLGGSIGTLAGMYLFRHKTKHLSFVIGMPMILVLQVIAVFVFRIITKSN